MRRMARLSGITLVELLLALALVGVMTGLALPGFRDLVERNRSASALNQLIGATQLARHAAITLRTTVTMCPGVAAEGCTARDSWHQGILLFGDRDRDGRRDTDEQIIRTLPPLPAGTRVYWRSFRNRSYLQFNATGLTHWQNGHLLYCPASGDARFARALIINAQGRIRNAPDTDADDIREDANGAPLRCP
jgi:type IV fimbrial biogenesis protein FimT